MVRALVIYESMFGNTETVARAVAEGVGRYADVTLAEVRGARPEYAEKFDLVVVGGPTHAFSMTRPSTRADAERQGAPHRTPDIGIREWLDRLPGGVHHAAVATFDTRIDKVRRLPGSAARKAARVAHHHGYRKVAEPTSFYVEDVSGPLLEGERERAVAWGEQVAARAAELTAAP